MLHTVDKPHTILQGGSKQMLEVQHRLYCGDCNNRLRLTIGKSNYNQNHRQYVLLHYLHCINDPGIQKKEHRDSLVCGGHRTLSQ